MKFSVSLLVSFVITAFAGSALAQEFGNHTAIRADLRCEQAGGGIAVQLPTTASKGRVWQTDVGANDGLELDVTSFELSTCRGCFEFTAQLFGSTVRGKAVQNVLTYELFDAEQNTWTPLMEPVECKMVREI